MDHHQVASFLAQLHHISDNIRQIAIHTKPDGNAWRISIWLIGANAAVAFATLGMIVATFVVATRTKELGKDTLSGLDQADRHHQESRSPIVLLRPPSIKWPTCKDETYAENRYKVTSTLGTALTNIGFGPAMTTVLSVSFEGQECGPINLGSVEVGTRDIKYWPLEWMVKERPDFSNADTVRFDVSVISTSVFGAANTVRYLVTLAKKSKEPYPTFTWDTNYDEIVYPLNIMQRERRTINETV